MSTAWRASFAPIKPPSKRESNCASERRLRFTDAPEVLVWVENRAGYANLCRLLTAGKRRAEKGQCLLRLEDLSGGVGGAAGGIDGPEHRPADAGEIADDALSAAAQAIKERHGGSAVAGDFPLA